MHASAYTHTYVHTHIHTRTHIHTHTRTHVCTHVRTHTHVHTHTVVHIQSHTHTYIHTPMESHACMCAHSHIQMHLQNYVALNCDFIVTKYTNSFYMRIADAIYAVYLVNIKFGELKCNANWWTFSLANRVLYIECTLPHNRHDFLQCGCRLNLAIKAKIAKPPN